jgi:Carbohydrate esterase, sialic acid-specific acetylesterase
MRIAALCVTAPLIMAALARSATVTLTSPLDYQVFQRTTMDSGAIRLRGRADAPCDAAEARIEAHPWQRIPSSPPCAFDGNIAAPAGGWYGVEVRVLHNRELIGGAGVEHAGVGEVFVISGQSNSTNYGEEAQRTRTQMVATFSGAEWRQANDPQPGVQDTSQQGSFIPAFGDALFERYRVPIGIASVGSGSTSVRQWLPKGDRFRLPPTNAKFVTQAADGQWESTGKLFDGMLDRIRQLGLNGFRAVLWHQGESDAHQGPGHEIDPTDYRRMMERLIREMRTRAGWDFAWFVAQATYHGPTDTGAPEIRAAQAALWEEGLALQGPDTDTLTGDNRQNNGTGVHMSAKGLQAHGRIWAEAVEAWLDRTARPTHPAFR